MKKLLATLLASTMALSAIGGLVACGGDDNGGGAGVDLPSEADLLVWCSDGAKPCYEELVNTFKQANPKAKNWTVTVTAKSEGDTLSQLQTDITTGPDIFMFASDHINTMVTGKLLQPLIAPFSDRVKARDAQDTIDPVKMVDENGVEQIYAYPNVNSNGYFLTYDTEVFTSPSDVESLDTMIEKAKAAKKQILFNYGNGFYNPAFFFALDVKIGATHQNGEVDVNNAKGTAIGKTMIKYFTQTFTDAQGKEVPVFVGDGGNNNAAAVGFKDGTMCAAVEGTWINEKGYLDKAIEDMGVKKERFAFAKLPKFKVTDSGELNGDYQLSSFKGAKYCGVNPTKSEETILASLALADWFNNEVGQMARYEATQETPTNIKGAASEAVKSNPMLVALAEQNKYAHPQLTVPTNFWSALEAFGNGIAAKTITLNGNGGAEGEQSLAEALSALDKSLKATK